MTKDKHKRILVWQATGPAFDVCGRCLHITCRCSDDAADPGQFKGVLVTLEELKNFKDRLVAVKDNEPLWNTVWDEYYKNIVGIECPICRGASCICESLSPETVNRLDREWREKEAKMVDRFAANMFAEVCAACNHAKHVGNTCFYATLPDSNCRCGDSQSRKADAGKPNSFRLIPWQSIIELASVYEYGAKKYEANSWRQVPNGVQRYEDALMRHLIAYFQGEEKDKESGLRHLAHALWNVVALMELNRQEILDTKIESK